MEFDGTFVSLVDIVPNSERIWKFTNLYKYVVVADIVNYFDCIHHRSATLWHLVESENLLNFLFLLEAFSLPYYMPHSGVDYPNKF